MYNDGGLNRKEKNMKRTVIILVGALALTSVGLADQPPYYTYTYGPGTDFGGLDLTGSQSILVNGGGGIRWL